VSPNLKAQNRRDSLLVPYSFECRCIKSPIKIVQCFGMTSVRGRSVRKPIVVDKSKVVQKIKPGIEQFASFKGLMMTARPIHSSSFIPDRKRKTNDRSFNRLKCQFCSDQFIAVVHESCLVSYLVMCVKRGNSTSGDCCIVIQLPETDLRISRPMRTRDTIDARLCSLPCAVRGC